MGWGQVDIVAGETRANVIPLQEWGRVAARRRAGQRTDVSRQHPSMFSDPNGPATAEEIAAVVREIDEHRRVAGATSAPEAPLNDLAQRVAAVTDSSATATGDYTVDEFGFDPHFNDAIVRPLLRFFFRSWFRVEVSGIENLPTDGAALLVANHAGVLPFDGLMLSVPFTMRIRRSGTCDCWPPTWCSTCRSSAKPPVGPGHTMACTTDAHRLLAAGNSPPCSRRATRAWASGSRIAIDCSGLAVAAL